MSLEYDKMSKDKFMYNLIISRVDVIIRYFRFAVFYQIDSKK